MAWTRKVWTDRDHKAILHFLAEEIRNGNPDAAVPAGYRIWEKAIKRGVINRTAAAVQTM